MASFGPVVSLRYATISLIALILTTWVLDGIGVFGADASINFAEEIRTPSAPSSVFDALGFLTDLVLIPYDVVMLFVDIMTLWVDLAFQSGAFAPIILVVPMVLALTIAVWMISLAQVLNDLIPLT